MFLPDDQGEKEEKPIDRAFDADQGEEETEASTDEIVSRTRRHPKAIRFDMKNLLQLQLRRPDETNGIRRRNGRSQCGRCRASDDVSLVMMSHVESVAL